MRGCLIFSPSICAVTWLSICSFILLSTSLFTCIFMYVYLRKTKRETPHHHTKNLSSLVLAFGSAYNSLALQSSMAARWEKETSHRYRHRPMLTRALQHCAWWWWVLLFASRRHELPQFLTPTESEGRRVKGGSQRTHEKVEGDEGEWEKVNVMASKVL